MAQKLIANNAVDIAVEETPDFIHLDLTLSAGENCCRVVVKGTHTNVVELYINGQPQPLSEKQNTRTQRETLPLSRYNRLTNLLIASTLMIFALFSTPRA